MLHVTTFLAVKTTGGRLTQQPLSSGPAYNVSCGQSVLSEPPEVSKWRRGRSAGVEAAGAWKKSHEVDSRPRRGAVGTALGREKTT